MQITKTIFTPLEKSIKMKGVDHLTLEHSKIGNTEYFALPNFSDGISQHSFENIEAIVYRKGADDTNRLVLSNGWKIMRSCDTCRAMVILPDNTVYLTDPYFLWDKWLRQSEIDLTLDNLNIIYAKGTIKHHTVTITHINEKLIK